MTKLSDLPFYDRDPVVEDHDPATGEVVTEAVRSRVAQGLKELANRLQRPLTEAAELEHQRHLEELRRANAKIGERDGHIVPDGCSIPVSPSLIKSLEPNRSRQV